MGRQVLPDPRILSRRRVAFPLSIAFMVVGVIAAYRTPPGSLYIIPTACAVGAGLCMIAMSGPLPFYRCPACRMRLREPTYLEPDEGHARPIHFICPECDVEWDTGWTHGGSVGA